MSQIVEIKVPDIGNYTGVDVIDVAVKVGDSIAVDDTLITLETDKATMDVPADHAGVVKEVLVKVGDKVSEGTVIVKVEAANAATAPSTAAEAPAKAAASETTNAATQAVAVNVPDIGNFSNVDVIEVDIKVGDEVAVDQTLVTLETDKATMDVPSTVAGKVTAVHVKVGDKVSEGSALIEVAAASASADAAAPATPAQKEAAEIKKQVAATPTAENNDLRAEIKSHIPQAFGSSDIDEKGFAKAHASPSVRKLARELGVDLGRVTGSGRKGRITPVDLRSFVKSVMQKVEQGGAGASLGGGLDLLPWPKVDFSKFGEIEVKELSRIKKISGQNLARNWVMIPHVTLHEDADMTDLEAFRKQLNKEWERAGIKVSPLAFIILACVKALQEFPEFNSSLDGDNLILKKYIHIGFAADTPNGLVVPVIKNADQKGLKEITQELADMSKRAREGKLKPQEMQGASFTISSLGGIGGTGFTPIVNAPEVAILGVCKSQIKPSWNGKEFEPRLQCPLSLSFDHRVIDGAAGMRFLVFISQLLADFRRVSL
ncbi:MULTISPECIES: dihydrolipoyllysine-residue acetyltransferase [Snodgrassella]|uniref:Acetyltransferase component of pyruvate dehydrogenase complex n=1 Tax=Snodgrassella alvi TaxID=1196083 RepID=A0A2N9WSJ8_9NEIS|nr:MULTISPECIES: dihydrolipoyllysine-residue acetyltransferase [Snodgrassella]NUE65678.1 dihydrolipoyllysine-residue acetyltransferase [Snodgrassella sp. ESL0253]PIT12546.1 dihydrolipoyllysine-residue acetyltransferase [Snodgrassella alvi]PIT13837.1 dihydrolipoyllysine-residue acetyltransferase [Snodgrassella alvi]PIT17036.1 dihydrolipoyllysine-residue acetyltransferase [Snodgrassella alvi]